MNINVSAAASALTRQSDILKGCISHHKMYGGTVSESSDILDYCSSRITQTQIAIV